MQEYNEQTQSATGAENVEHPAGEMMLPKRGTIGARARALSGLAFSAGMTLLAFSPDTTIHERIIS